MYSSAAGAPGGTEYVTGRVIDEVSDVTRRHILYFVLVNYSIIF